MAISQLQNWQGVNGKIKITKKVGLTITSYGNDRLPTGYLF